MPTAPVTGDRAGHGPGAIPVGKLKSCATNAAAELAKMTDEVLNFFISRRVFKAGHGILILKFKEKKVKPARKNVDKSRMVG